MSPAIDAPAVDNPRADIARPFGRRGTDVGGVDVVVDGGTHANDFAIIRIGGDRTSR